ncbi:MAG: class I tRNA ligase family protein, partial [Candidatus Bathyarchaeota archaeon]
VYMSYYTIAKQIKERKVNAEKLDDEVFDYILLGIGNPTMIGEKKGLDSSLLQEMRSEFSYFYPLDSRHSGRDLVPNHLTYFIFNHIAIFPNELWPRQIVVNGSVLMEGKKMSKSFGNVIPLKDALKSYGADPFRVAVLATAELLQDADFSNILAKSICERLERFYSFTLQIVDMEEDTQERSLKTIDMWLLSRLQQRIKTVTVAMENIRFREAIHNVLYMLDQDIQWYLRRSLTEEGRESSVVLRQVMEIRTLLLAPFAPHLCEEIWEKMGRSSFASAAEWPCYDEDKIDIGVIEGEELVRTLRDDLSNIIQATKTTPKKIFFYTTSGWKWKTYMATLGLAAKGQLKVNDLMKRLMADSELKKYAKQVSAFTQKIAADLCKMPEDLIMNRLDIGVLDEIKIIMGAKSFYEREFNAEISVLMEDNPDRYDPKDRARLAEPYRPAIYVE